MGEVELHARVLAVTSAFSEPPPRGEVVPADAYARAMAALRSIAARHAPEVRPSGVVTCAWCSFGVDNEGATRSDWPCLDFADGAAAVGVVVERSEG